jgi:4-carboxymuconolactone decarboxylase
MGSNFKPAILAAMVSGLALSSAHADPAPIPPAPRLAAVPQEAYTPAQTAAAAEFVAEFGRAPAGGPFGVYFRRPDFALAALRMYRDIKGPYSWDAPESRLVNLAVMIVSRRYGANIEWSSHSASGLKSGVSPQVVAAIRQGETPAFARDDERMVYEVVTDLLVRATVPQSTYDRATAVLGTDRLVQIVAATGFYTTLAMGLVTFDNSVLAPVVYQPLPPLPGK